MVEVHTMYLLGALEIHRQRFRRKAIMGEGLFLLLLLMEMAAVEAQGPMGLTGLVLAGETAATEARLLFLVRL